MQELQCNRKRCEPQFSYNWVTLLMLHLLPVEWKINWTDGQHGLRGGAIQNTWY